MQAVLLDVLGEYSHMNCMHAMYKELNSRIVVWVSISMFCYRDLIDVRSLVGRIKSVLLTVKNHFN